MTNHTGIRAALIAAAGTLALMSAACGANSTTASGTAATATASTSPSAGSGEGDTGAGATGTATKSPTPKASTPKASPTAASGPQIVSFKVTKQPMCPVVGTADAPYSAPGQDVTIGWKVTGATKVSLSVDGPGIYRDNYGPEDTQQLSFGCDTSNPQSSHKYTLTATGSGQTKSQTITVTIQSKP